MNYFEEKVFEGLESEIKLIYCGKRIHNLGHYFGPYTRDQFLIYYIKDGCATLELDGRETELSAKGFFVNFPNSKTVYRCTENVPWSIHWIAADGRILEQYLSLLGITRSNPFIRLNSYLEVEQIFEEMFEHFDNQAPASKLYCISLLYKLFSLLSDVHLPGKSSASHAHSAQALMERHFADSGFNVTKLSRMMGLHHNYISILYKKETGTSLVTALCEIRLKNACKLLRFTDKPVKEVAALCGFADELYFSRVFRKKLQMSPSAYRMSEEYPI